LQSSSSTWTYAVRVLVGHTTHNDESWLLERASALELQGNPDTKISFAKNRANKQFWQSQKLIEIAKDLGVTIDGSPHNGENDASVDIAATST
jgi:hypothetical protein